MLWIPLIPILSLYTGGYIYSLQLIKKSLMNFGYNYFPLDHTQVKYARTLIVINMVITIYLLWIWQWEFSFTRILLLVFWSSLFCLFNLIFYIDSSLTLEEVNKSVKLASDLDAIKGYTEYFNKDVIAKQKNAVQKENEKR